MEETVIYKHLIAETSAEEETELQNWLEASAKNKQLFFDIKAIWETRRLYSDETNPMDAYESLAKMNKKLDQINTSKYKNKNLKKKILIYTNIAAAILIALFIFPKKNDHSSLRLIYTHTNLLSDSIKQVTLQDGTIIWLAPNTTIAYTGKYLNNNRIVKLKGLAFFEVTKNTSHPFIVETETFKVKVLGTSFAVNSNNATNKGETVLLRGSVQLEDRNGRNIIQMYPGQQTLYSEKEKSLEINEIDAKIYTLWRFHLIPLIDVSIKDIINSIESIYKVHISMDTVNLANHKYIFYYKKSNSLEDTLEKLFYLTGKKATIIP